MVAIGKMANEEEETWACLIALFLFPSLPAPLFHWEKPGRTVKGLEIKWNQKENGSNFFLHLLQNFEWHVQRWKKLFLYTAAQWDLFHLSGSSWSWPPWASLIVNGGK